MRTSCFPASEPKKSIKILFDSFVNLLSTIYVIQNNIPESPDSKARSKVGLPATHIQTCSPASGVTRTALTAEAEPPARTSLSSSSLGVHLSHFEIPTFFPGDAPQLPCTVALANSIQYCRRGPWFNSVPSARSCSFPIANLTNRSVRNSLISRVITLLHIIKNFPPFETIGVHSWFSFVPFAKVPLCLCGGVPVFKSGFEIRHPASERRSTFLQRKSLE
jgi:hypothetical protein